MTAIELADYVIVDSIRSVNPFDKSSVMEIALKGDKRIPGIKSHILRTAYYTKLIVRELYSLNMYPDIISEEYRDFLPIAAALHDIGKLKIPLEILDDRRKLDHYEFEEMKKHITYGAEYIDAALKGSKYKRFLELTKNVILYHHEKWDGTGYLAGLKGKDIPLEARIVAVADVFDALTSKRSYKEAFTYEYSIEYIKKKKRKHFDPDILGIFLKDSVQDKVKMVLSGEYDK